MTLQWLLEWYNLIFLLPLFLALFYVGIYAISGLTFGETDMDASGDVDPEAHIELDGHAAGPAEMHHDLDHDLNADADADADADVHTDADTDAHGAGEGHDAAVAPGSVLATVLSLLGVGKVPLSILLTMLL